MGNNPVEDGEIWHRQIGWGMIQINRMGYKPMEYGNKR